MKRVAIFALGLVSVAKPADGQSAQDVRRIVTGTSPQGTAVLVEDDSLSGIRFETLPGLQITPLWSTSRDPELPAAGADPWGTADSFLPEAGETRFLIFRLPSSAEVASGVERGYTPEAFHREYAEKVPDLARSHDAENPRLHATETVDYVIVLTGDIVLELGDGSRVNLTTGDVVIQNGTSHAWHNIGEDPAVLAAVMVGVRPQDPDRSP